VLYRCAATCFNNYLVILRPLKSIKRKITIATLVVGGQIEISVFGVTKRMSIKILDPSPPHN
jgi:hypothetical protein